MVMMMMMMIVTIPILYTKSSKRLPSCSKGSPKARGCSKTKKTNSKRKEAEVSEDEGNEQVLVIASSSGEKKLVVNEKASITCTVCTFLNATGASACGMCGGPIQHPTAAEAFSNSNTSGEKKQSGKVGQECLVCTFLNTAGASACGMCSTALRPLTQSNPTPAAPVRSSVTPIVERRKERTVALSEVQTAMTLIHLTRADELTLCFFFSFF